jgi:hypothetical protein
VRAVSLRQPKAQKEELGRRDLPSHLRDWIEQLPRKTELSKKR